MMYYGTEMNASHFGVKRSQVTVQGHDGRTYMYAGTITVQVEGHTVLDVSCRVRLSSAKKFDFLFLLWLHVVD